MTTWQKSPMWQKRLNGFFSYQYAAWMALFVPIQVDLAMREVLNEQFSAIAGEATEQPLKSGGLANE